jgi:hypothetical protein
MSSWYQEFLSHGILPFFAEKVVSDLSESWSTYPSVSASFIHLPLKIFPGSSIHLLSEFLIVSEISFVFFFSFCRYVESYRYDVSKFFHNMTSVLIILMPLSRLWCVEAYFTVRLIDVIITDVIPVLSVSLLFSSIHARTEISIHSRHCNFIFYCVSASLLSGQLC